LVAGPLNLALQHLTDRALGLLDRKMSVSIAAGIGIGNSHPPERLSGKLDRVGVVVSIKQ
jgi:hypothetical protein